MSVRNTALDYEKLAQEAEGETFDLDGLKQATQEDNERHFRAFVIDRLDEINRKLDKIARAS